MTTRLRACNRRAIPFRIADLIVPRNAEESREAVAAIIGSLSDSQLKRLWDLSRTPGNPSMAQRDKAEDKVRSDRARKVLLEGLKYHEHDGHDMPKRVARKALEALGVKEEEQP